MNKTQREFKKIRGNNEYEFNHERYSNKYCVVTHLNFPLR